MRRISTDGCDARQALSRSGRYQRSLL